MEHKKNFIIILLSFFSLFLFADENLEILVNDAMESNPEISAIEFQIKALNEKDVILLFIPLAVSIYT